MKTIYKAKVDYLFFFIVLLIVGLSSLPLLFVDNSWFGLVILITIALFIVYGFTSTVYEIEDNKLNIRSIGSKSKSILIDSIKSISETKNFLSSPSPSFDRLEITYNQKQKIMISPKYKHEFLHDIKTVNPNIEIIAK
jgi:ABC-type bacteriocin/lantibiotic exporter with double-glycine peptidase domain